MRSPQTILVVSLTQRDTLWLILTRFLQIDHILSTCWQVMHTFHHLHCDAFEQFFASNNRAAAVGSTESDFDNGMHVLDFVHFVAKTSNAVFQVHVAGNCAVHSVSRML